jgi:hypothetical protein
MRLDERQLDAYLAGVAALLERYGVVLRLPGEGEDLELLEDDDGVLTFELWGDLPAGAERARATVIIREAFSPAGDGTCVRSRYEYELLDLVRDYRRAFHLHFPEWFEAAYLVVVHEHCERPVGHAACDHYEGPPIRDAYAGVEALMRTWTADPPDCSALRCLDSGSPGSMLGT